MAMLNWRENVDVLTVSRGFLSVIGVLNHLELGRIIAENGDFGYALLGVGRGWVLAVKNAKFVAWHLNELNQNQPLIIQPICTTCQ
ncbi:hypothetical protein [Moraxella lacunata]|uniref:hypothetical protein n=1 Tax=Moraxella lacunata TaxID=477 RepID=UPI003EE0F6BC